MAEPRGMNGRLVESKAGQAQPTVGKKESTWLSPTSLRAQPERPSAVWSRHGPLSPCHFQGLGTLTLFTFFSVPQTGW